LSMMETGVMLAISSDNIPKGIMFFHEQRRPIL